MFPEEKGIGIKKKRESEILFERRMRILQRKGR